MSDDSTTLIPIACSDQFAIVDAKDAEDILQFRWRIVGAGYLQRAQKVRGKTITESMHRRICPCPHGMVVDHINRNKLDNRRSNLRCGTRSQNSANNSSVRGVSGYRGVHRNGDGKKWRACYSLKDKLYYIGTLPTPEEAARAYDAAAIEAYGDFARLNFPEEHSH